MVVRPDVENVLQIADGEATNSVWAGCRTAGIRGEVVVAPAFAVVVKLVQMLRVVVDVVYVQLFVRSGVEGSDCTIGRCNAAVRQGGEIHILPVRVVIPEVVNVIRISWQLREHQKHQAGCQKSKGWG